MMRLAILGASQIARRAVLCPLRQVTECDVRVRIVGRDAERTARFAAENGVAQWSTSCEKTFASGEVDAVYVALPNALHAEVATDAARAGLDVLIEKPICLSGGELARIAEAADASGAHVSEAVMITHHPWLAHLAALQQRHGAIARARTELWFDTPAERLARIPRAIAGGGILYDVASYWLAMTQQTAGLDVLDCSVDVIRAEGGRDFQVAARVVLRSGAVAELSAGYGRFRASHEVVFEGTRSCVENFLRPAVGTAMLRVVTSQAGREPEKTTFAASNYYVSQLRDFIAGRALDGRGSADLAAARERMQVFDRLVPSLLEQVS